MSNNDEKGSSDNVIKSVLTGFRIIEFLRENGEQTIQEVSEGLDLPRSTAHVYLKTLREVGYVVVDSGRYSLGLRFLHQGGFARHQNQLYHVAQREVDKLSEEVGEAANLGVEENGQRVLLYKSEASDGVYDNPPVGQFTNMHWTSLGKAILSSLAEEDVEGIVAEHGLPKATENTITSLDALMDELADIRDRGYSIEDEERRRGIRALAVPIECDDDTVGAISVSGPRSRILDKEADIVDALESTANVIELSYNHYG